MVTSRRKRKGDRPAIAQEGNPASLLATQVCDILRELDQALTKVISIFPEAMGAWAKELPQESRKKVAARFGLVHYALEALMDEVDPLLERWDAKP